MAAQGVQRREVLRILASERTRFSPQGVTITRQPSQQAMAARVAPFPGFSRWSIACGHDGSAITHIKPATYQPIFFTAPEYALIERLTDIMIPTDDDPGAREAGISEFIDVMASRGLDLQRHFRGGLSWLNAHSHRMQVSNSWRSPLTSRLIFWTRWLMKTFRAGEQDDRIFFNRMREYIIKGFYTGKVGLTELDFPGLKFYSSSPSCAHQDDPEHLHLPPPQW